MKGNRFGSPLVSIVINNYNYGRFLRDSIESALKQSYPHTEVIIVDDGSSDNSREVIAEYYGRVRAIFKDNGGQASAFNVGFASSEGDIVIFLDADDLLLPNAVEEVVSVWEPGLSKVQWRLQHVTEDLRPLPATWPLERSMPSGDLRGSLLKWGYYPCPPTSGNAFARSFLERVLPMPEAEWRIAADSYLLSLAAVSGNIRSIDKVLGYYRVHGTNYWHLGKESFEEAKHKLLQQLKIYRIHKELLQALQGGKRKLLHHPSPYAAKLEMALALLEVESPSISLLNRMRIALRGIYATALYPYMPSLWSRMRLAAWFLLTATLPWKAAAQISMWGLLPSTRPRWLVKLLRAHTV